MTQLRSKRAIGAYARFAALVAIPLITLSVGVSASAASPGSGEVGESVGGEIGRGYVGDGWVDIHSLNIVGTEGSDEILLPEALLTSGQQRTVPVGCAGRIDFYRVIDRSGYTRCYADAGSYPVPRPRQIDVYALCPGNNTGRVSYRDPLNLTQDAYSTWRDGRADWTQCWNFTPNDQEVLIVEIRRIGGP